MDDQQPSEGQDIQDSASETQETYPLDKGGDHSEPILVRRMFEVFCISIHPMERALITYPTFYKVNSLLDGNPCRIYGLVRVFSEDGQVLIDIYNRKEVNCEIVPLGGFLSITSSHVISPAYLKVVVYLYDMTHDAEIANGVFDLDYRYTNKYYDEPKEECVTGQHGFASIQYSTFQHAVVATVENVVLNQVGESGCDANNGMLRTVTALIERTYKDDDCDEEFPPSILFQNKQGSDPFHFGVPVKLFRTSIVVPAFCNLVISFSDDADHKVVKDIIFEVRDGRSIRKSSQGQYCELEMNVKWRQGYASERTHPVCISDYFSFPRVLLDEQSSSNIASAIPKAFPYVEIFSVLIWINDVDEDISGTVVMADSSCDPFHIFNGNERWFPGTTLPIIGPPCSFDNRPFEFKIQIQDEEHRWVSKGTFEWNWEDDDDCPMSFYDKPLCSVIQGQVGHAAVHYAMISCGIQARIRVTISKCCPPFPAQVYGKITAAYSGYKYPTLYDEEYYKSTLFSKTKSECVHVTVDQSARELPLAKSVMSVPLDDLLVLDLDLVLLSHDGDVKSDKNWVHVKERLEYQTNVNTTDVTYVEEYSFSVHLQWSDKRK